MYVMVASISGTRDGQDWPRPGQPVDFLSAEEAEHLVSIGHVRIVETADAPAAEAPSAPDPVTAVAAGPETRTTRAGGKPRTTRGKQTV